MSSYIGTKLVNAKPMTRQEYNDFRGWKLPEDERGDDEGYLVEYVDAGKANTAEYTGYVSWSPAEVFERAYQPNETPMQRMLIEQATVVGNLGRLDDLVNKGRPSFIDANHWKLIKKQHKVMQQYHDVLILRIADLQEKSAK